MKLFLLVNIFLSLWSKFNSIHEANLLKQEAAVAYERKEYTKAIDLYKILLNSKQDQDEKIVLDLAHCYYKVGNIYNASIEYKTLTTSSDMETRSIAYLQLGVIYHKNNKKESAINAFKEALKADPSNESARYNYEILKKENEKEQKQLSPDQRRENENGKNQQGVNNSMEERKDPSGKEENKNTDDSEHGDSDENSGNKDNQEDLQIDDGGSKELDALTSKRLEEMNINEQKALTILNAMKSAEVQYIQQKRKNTSGKAQNNRPDW